MGGGAGTFLTTSSGKLGEEMGAAKLSQSQLKEHDEDTAKKQRAGSVRLGPTTARTLL